MNDQSHAIATQREAHPIEILKSIVARKSDEFRTVLPAHISVEKFQRTIATAALSNPSLLTCDRQSLLMSAMKLAQDGLLPDGREAALVPFKEWNKDTRETTWKVQPMPMAYGLRKKILQSGQVVSLEAGVVYRREVEEGHFIYEVGMEPPIRHRPMLDMTDDDMADANIIAAYSIARIKNDQGGDPYWSVEVLRRSDLNKIQNASQTGATIDRNGKPRTPKGPWADWYAEMCKKSALRRHSKVLPMSGDLLDTILRDDDIELRARGTHALLQVEPDAPVTLPAPDEDEPEDDLPRDEATGMTVVDEETARGLDASDEDEMYYGDDGEPEPDEPSFLDRIAAAKSADALVQVDADWERAKGDCGPDEQAAISKAMADRFRALATAKK